jgi:hypothetical protein
VTDSRTTTNGGSAGDGGPSPTARDTARAIRALGRETTTDLARRFSDLTGRPMRTRNRDALLPAVARRLAASCPDLAPSAYRRALRAALDLSRTPRPPFRHDARVPRPGTTLRHGSGPDAVEVLVTRTGFLWQGRSYDSLSRIAQEASGGTPWNGFLYFGLAVRERRPPPWRAR